MSPGSILRLISWGFTAELRQQAKKPPAAGELGVPPDGPGEAILWNELLIHSTVGLLIPKVQNISSKPSPPHHYSQ